MTFQKFGFITLICVYLLVLAGGIVRSTGSGMGCPDWPKCFGMLIPPTQASELPFNYQEIYKAKLHGEIAFNASKTWIEYLNRLLGAITGLCMLVSTFLARKEKRPVFLYSLAALFLVVANAILGKYVVDSFLLPGVVTSHMLLTIGVIYFLLKALNHNKERIEVNVSQRKWILLNACIIFAQILMGTQVRESTDHVIKLFGENSRSLWIENLPSIYIIHRTFSWIVLFSHFYLWRNLKTMQTYKNIAIGLVGISLISGVIMAYIDLPFGSQPIHLTTSILLIGFHMNAWQNTKNA